MTSGDEDIGGDDDPFGCSFKTVIHRPGPHFYIPTTDNPPQQIPAPQPVPLTPSPLIPAPAIPVLVLASPPVNYPMQHRAHTDTDLLYYNQGNQPVFYPANWYTPIPPGFIFAAAPPPPPPVPPSYLMQQASFRHSSADCRRTANNVNEPHVIHPERVW